MSACQHEEIIIRLQNEETIDSLRTKDSELLVALRLTSLFNDHPPAHHYGSPSRAAHYDFGECPSCGALRVALVVDASTSVEAVQHQGGLIL